MESISSKATSFNSNTFQSDDDGHVSCFEMIVSGLKSITNMVIQHTVGDIPYLAWDDQKFITTELYNRSIETGVGQAYIGPKSLCYFGLLPTITLVSGDKLLVKQVTEYSDEDPAARASFKIVTKLTSGVETLATMSGTEATEQKKMIKHHLAGEEALKQAYNVTLKLISTYFRDWDKTISVQDQITYISVNIIGRAVFGIPEVPMKFVPTLQAAGRLILQSRHDPVEVDRLARDIKTMCDEFMAHEEAGKFASYPLMQLQLKGGETQEEIIQKLKELNVGAGLVVEGNLTFLIVTGILLINKHPEVLAKLQAELSNIDLNHAHNDICVLPYLECIYNELLRFTSPTGLIDRQVSQPYMIAGKVINGGRSGYHVGGSIVGHSHLMVSVYNIHHDRRYWVDPYEFNPSRFEGERGSQLKKHLIPFSVGKRACPAGSAEGTSFVATVAKLTIAYFVKNFDLQLHSELKDLPKNTAFGRWEPVHASVTPK